MGKVNIYLYAIGIMVFLTGCVNNAITSRITTNKGGKKNINLTKEVLKSIVVEHPKQIKHISELVWTLSNADYGDLLVRSGLKKFNLNVEAIEFEHIRNILEKFKDKTDLEELIINNFHIKHIVLEETDNNSDEIIYNEKVNIIKNLVNDMTEKNPKLRFIIQFRGERNEKLILNK